MRDVIVLDTGSHSTKVGFGGESLPRYITPTVVGHDPITPTCLYVGCEALQRRSTVTITRPIVRGRIQNWVHAEELWHQTFLVDLNIDPENHPVLLTESPEEPARNREKKTEIFFEDLRVPQFSLATQSVLALHADGRTSGTVIDIGAGHTAVVPVLEGKIIPHAMVPMSLSGEDITLQLLMSLKQYGLRRGSTTHWDLVNHMKEKLCYVTTDDKWRKCRTSPQHYTLPDLTRITLSPQQQTIPDTLFRGEQSVQASFVRAVSSLEDDIRGVLSSHVILTGGTTDCPGFRQVLSRELRDQGVVEVGGKTGKGRYLPWIGGSVLSSLSTFGRMSVLRSEYEEFGSGLINRRCRMEDGSDDFYGLYGFSGS